MLGVGCVGAAPECKQPLDIDRLDEVVGRADAHRFDGAVDRRVAGDHHHLGLTWRLEVVDEIGSAAVGQLQIGEQHIGRLANELRPRTAQRVGSSHGVALRLDHFRHPAHDVGFIVDDQSVRHGNPLSAPAGCSA